MSSQNRRTLKYAPVNRPDKIRLAIETNADAVILDLESTVVDADKKDARNSLDAIINEYDFSEKEIVVRINGLDTDHWLADLNAALEAGADTIRLPKIEEFAEIHTVIETTRQVSGSMPEFLIQLESPRGIVNGGEIAKACANLPMVTGIGIGIGDYTTALGLDNHTPPLRHYLLNATAAYAAIGNMDPLAYVHKDIETLQNATEQAKALGHVGQPISFKVESNDVIDMVNDIYSS